MNEMATQYLDKEKLVDVIILDEIIYRCKQELNNIKYINECTYDDNISDILIIKMKSINTYLLYSDYIHDFIEIANDIISIDIDTIINDNENNVSHLIRFLVHVHQIVNIISYYVNSTKIIEDIDDDIKFVEITIETKKQDIDNIVCKYKTGEMSLKNGGYEK